MKQKQNYLFKCAILPLVWALFIVPVTAYSDSIYRCQSIFEAVQKIDNRTNSRHHTQSTPFLVDYDQNSRKFVTTYFIEEVYGSKDFDTHVFRTHRKFGLPEAWNQDLQNELLRSPTRLEQVLSADQHLLGSQEAVLEKILPLVKMANEKFETRRGWGKTVNVDGVRTNDFSEKNILVAKKYLLHSNYVIVKDKNGKIRGGIRSILVPDLPGYQLPAETYLSLELPKLGFDKHNSTHQQWKNEFGTYVVDNSLAPEIRHQVILEIWSHLFKFTFGNSELDYSTTSELERLRDRYFNQAIFTYGDKDSLKLYGPLGFRKLRIYKHKGQLVDYSEYDEKDIPAILPDGETEPEKGWWPMVLMPTDALDLNERFSTKGLMRADPTWLAERRREITDNKASGVDLGALFSDLQKDLQSKNTGYVQSALTGLRKLMSMASSIDTIRGNGSIANKNGRGVDPTLNDILERSGRDMMAIENDLHNFFGNMDQIIDQMPPKKRLLIVEFVKQLLQTRTCMDACRGWLYNLYKYEKGFYRLLGDKNSDVVEAMLTSIRNLNSPLDWLLTSGAAVDYSLPRVDPILGTVWPTEAEREKEIEETFVPMLPTYRKQLLDDGISELTSNELIKKVRKVLFSESHGPAHDGHGKSDDTGPDAIQAAAKAFINLPNSNMRVIRNIMILSFAEEHLEAKKKTELKYSFWSISQLQEWWKSKGVGRQ